MKNYLEWNFRHGIFFVWIYYGKIMRKCAFGEFRRSSWISGLVSLLLPSPLFV
jgi:hypothetical protein